MRRLVRFLNRQRPIEHMPLRLMRAAKNENNNPLKKDKMKKTILTAFAALALVASNALADETHTSGKFQGAKANTGTVTHMVKDGKNILTLSDDFKTPATPDPHWQVVDSKGNTYLLQKLTVKGDKMNRKITVPKYVPDIAKVQIWCAFAETNLGEAAFEHPVK